MNAISEPTPVKLVRVLLSRCVPAAGTATQLLITPQANVSETKVTTMLPLRLMLYNEHHVMLAVLFAILRGVLLAPIQMRKLLELTEYVRRDLQI